MSAVCRRAVYDSVGPGGEGEIKLTPSHPIVEQRPPAPFVVGAPRSGTTLLRLMLDSHPELAIPTETHFLFELVRKGDVSPLDEAQFYQTVTQHFTWPEFGLAAESLRSGVEALQPFALGDGLRTFYTLYAARFGKRRWGEKTPDYGFIMPQIQAHLPEAHFIHIVRDGRDVALSKRNLWFGPGPSIAAQASDWAHWITTARQLAQSCRYYMEVTFEELVANAPQVLARICEFIDLPFDNAMLAYPGRAAQRHAEFKDWPDQSVTAEQRHGIVALTLSAPRQDRIFRWKTEMSADEQSTFEAIAGRQLRELGYEVREELS